MTSTSGNKILAGVVTTIVVGAVISAIVLLDPPGVQRQRKMDSRRIEDLVSIQRAIEEYWTRHKALPPDLATLGKEPGLLVPASDPETGARLCLRSHGPQVLPALCRLRAYDGGESRDPQLPDPMGPRGRAPLFRPEYPERRR